MLGGDLAKEELPASDGPKRLHVTFAPLPPSALAPHRPRARLVDRELRLEESDRGALKPVFTQLRTPYAEGGWSFGVILLIICGLILLFIAIWWAVDRLLLLEIEEQIPRPSRATLRA
jgi:hypothetical protein